jgi:hypothetical protein
MRRRRNNTPADIGAQTFTVAQRLAVRLGRKLEELRYVEIRFHDGRQWTRVARWEQRIDGQWLEVDWTVVG